MTKLRLSILLAVIAIAIEVTAIVLLVPVIITGAGGSKVYLLLPVIMIGVLVALAAGVLRRQAKAAAHQAAGA